MVTPETKRVLAIIISFGGDAPLLQSMSRLQELLVRYCSATSLDLRIVA